MNIDETSRSLLLEQLESRSVLAGGIFLQVFDPRERQEYERTSRSQAAETRSSVNDRGPQRRIDANDVNHFVRDRGGPRGDFNLRVNSINVQSQPLLQSGVPESIQTPSQQTRPSIVVIVEPRGSFTPARQPSSDNPSQETGDRLANATVDDANLSQVSATEMETTINQTNEAIAQTIAATDVVFFGDKAASTSQTQASALAFSLNEDHAIQSPDVDELDTAIGGTIETLPLIYRDLHTPNKSANEDLWQLDTKSIQRIRKVAEAPVSPADDNTDRINDVVIASWFKGQSGLMEVEATGKLPMPVDLTDSIVNVVLEATVGLHRSVDLVAGEPTDPEGIPDNVRSAILAAIAADQPSPIASVTPEPTQAKLGGVSYVATAIIAGIAATRRRKPAKMESTRR
jgi:hypothetical protein